MDDRITIIQINTIATPIENIGYLKARRLIIGCFIFIWRKPNNKSDTTPTTIAMITFGLPQPASSPALLKPNTIPPNPIDDNTMERMSIFGFVTFVTFCMKRIPNINAITRNGSDSQKIQCQLRLSIRRPAIVGPIAGATMITNPIIPIAAPRFSGAMIIRIVLNISGKRSAVPIACTTRAVNRNSKLGDTAAKNVPSIEKHKAATNNCLVENH
ncbi:hypothetical protein D3C71_1360030 [compost metagenome]